MSALRGRDAGFQASNLELNRAAQDDELDDAVTTSREVEPQHKRVGEAAHLEIPAHMPRHRGVPVSQDHVHDVKRKLDAHDIALGHSKSPACGSARQAGRS